MSIHSRRTYSEKLPWMLVEAKKIQFSCTLYWHYCANGSKSLFLHVKEADVTWRNTENRCAAQKFLFKW